MSGIGKELSIFLEAVLAGIIVLACYQILRIIRRLVRHSLVVIAMEDFVFWISAAIFLFVEIYKTSDGSIRWFFVVGVLMGAFMLMGACQVAKRLVYRLF